MEVCGWRPEARFLKVLITFQSRKILDEHKVYLKDFFGS